MEAWQGLLLLGLASWGATDILWAIGTKLLKVTRKLFRKWEKRHEETTS